MYAECPDSMPYTIQPVSMKSAQLYAGEIRPVETRDDTRIESQERRWHAVCSSETVTNRITGKENTDDTSILSLCLTYIPKKQGRYIF